MAEKLDPKELVSFKELLTANSIQVDALTQLLIEKGIVTEQEFFSKLKRIKAEYQIKEPEQNCSNCAYYVPRNNNIVMIDGPSSHYCTHPDRVKGYYLTDSLIQELDLHREPHQWCSKYKRKSY